MEGASFEASKTWVLRVDPGEDVLRSLEAFIAEKRIEQGYVAAGYGTLSAASLHWVCHNRLPTDNLFAKQEGGIEILAMNGLIAEGKPHVHIALSMPNGAFGGHLEPGSICYVLCEIIIVELVGPKMTKPRVEVGKDAAGNPVTLPQVQFG